MTARNIWLVLTSLAVGPLIGAGVFLVAVFLTDGAGPDPSTVRGVLYYLPIILTMAYVLGAIPALISAIVMAVLSRFIAGLWPRLGTAALVGALVSGVAAGLVIFADATGSVDDVMIVGVFALAGAVAGFLCLALVEYFHPLPGPLPKPAAP